MRDPFSLVPVRVKLLLTFAFLYIVAFGLGGYIVTTAARAALERQIRLRLDDQAANAFLIVDRALELLQRRAEDFASDGHIRLALERLQAPGTAGAASAELRRELVRHLRANKLAMGPEIVDARVLDRTGKVLLHAVSTGSAATPAGFDRRDFRYGALQGPAPPWPYPTFMLSAPVASFDGTRRLGILQIVVRADVWAAGLRQALVRKPLDDLRVTLTSPDGYRLPVLPAAGGAGADASEARTRLSFSSVNVRTGGSVDVSVDRRSLTVPVSALISTFLLTGGGLTVLTTLLLFPSWQFLLKPLAELQNAARRISQGDFSVRVGRRSDDEVGQLGEAFNVMAGAVEERTRSLAQAVQDLRRREAEIRIEQERLEAVIHSMEDGLFILDGEGRVTLANAAAGAVIQALGDGRWPAQPCEVAVGPRIYDLLPAPLRDRDGQEVERIFVSRDITERMRQADRQAHQERLAVLGEIAAVIAHDLNNPLAAISMFTQMMLDGLNPSSPFHAHAAVVHRNTMSCKRTIRSLLDMAATSSPEVQDLDVRDVVDDVVELLQPVAGKVKTALLVDAEVDDGRIQGSGLQLRQALINLVMNAIQATDRTPGGEVLVGTLERGDDLVIRVRDNGPGIPEELRDHVFEPFFTTKPAGQGTGLGLPTTRRIAEAQGGRLILCDDSGAGTTFEMVVSRHKEKA